MMFTTHLTMLIVYACWMFTRKLPRANMV